MIARARAGDEAAFGELCRREAGHLRARAERLLNPTLRRKVAPSDVLQEAYIVAHERIRDFEDRGEGSFGAWLGRIVDLKAREAVRRFAGTAKRDPAIEVGSIGSGARHPAARGPSPSQALQAREDREAVARAIASLPSDYRTVLHLIQGEGLTLAAAAERMGRSRDSIKGLYARALARLAEDLGLQGGDEGSA